MSDSTNDEKVRSPENSTSSINLLDLIASFLSILGPLAATIYGSSVVSSSDSVYSASLSKYDSSEVDGS